MDRTCPCGAPIERNGKRGRLPERCNPCRTARRDERKRAYLKANRHRYHRNNHIPCVQCGKPTGWHMGKVGQLDRPPICHPCRRGGAGKAECSTDGCAKPISAKGMCRSHYAKWFRAKPPETDAERCTTDGCRRRACAKGKCLQHRNSEWRRETPDLTHARHSRRRAREADAFVADVDRRRVFEADGYRCHLCKRKTDPRKTVPHPRAPTVDHIIPLAQGGTHEPSNCRTACFSCNASKRDRGGGEQLLLIG